MEQELRIMVKIDKQTGELSTINAELNKLGDSTQKTSNHTNKLKESTNGLSGAFSTLKGIVASYIGLQTVVEYAKTSDAMSLLEARIKLVSKANDNYANTQKDLIKIAQENRVEYKSVGELYSRLSPAMQTLNADTRTVIDVTDSYSKSLLVSGASSEEAAGSTRQFSQAMASGVLRGEEFNSMMENAPRASRILMDTLGKTQGELRKMAENGELASGIVAGALLRSLGQMKDEASKMPNTISGEFQRIKNEATLTVEVFNKLTGANTALADDLSIITKKLADFREELPKTKKAMEEWVNTNRQGINTLDQAWDGLSENVIKYARGASLVMFSTVKQNIENGLTVVGTLGDKLGYVTDKQIEFNKTIQPQKVADLATAMDTLNKKMFNYNSLLFPEKMSMAPLLDLQKQREIAASALEKDGKEKVETTKRIKESTATINTQMAALEKQFSIQKEIQNLDVESMLISEKVTKPEAEKLKEINDIKSQIAKNQATINLLNSKAYDKNDTSADTDKVKDLEKINELKKDNELLTHKETAAQERYNATIKAGNEELKVSTYALNLSETDKSYLELTQKVKDLVTEGKNLELVGNYAEQLANQIARNDAYSHLQTELDIRSQMAEVSLYGTRRETALEQIRHDGVIANLSRELETKKLNADEYLKLLDIENQRNKQNSDSFYKFMIESFDNINKAMDENFFGVMTGKFKSWGAWYKDFFKSIGTSTAQGFSRTLAGGLTGNVQSGFVNMYKTYGGLSASSSLVGETVSADDLSKIMSGGGVSVDSGVITTAGGTKIDQATGQVKSQGNDALSLVSTASSLKTAYGLITAGISGSIITGFQTASGVLASMGMGGAATGLMSFGAGVANPFAYAGMSGLPTAMTIGSGLSAGLIGGAVGYGTGWLGDKIFGADTYAGTVGAIGGALGGIGASLGLWGGPIGIIAGSLLGSVLGGLFGKTKVTGQGIDILGNATADDVDGRYYTSYKKKSWFSSKSWENYTGFNAKELEAIKQTIGAYDYLLAQLGEYNDLVIAGGRFSNLQSFLDTNVVKTFLGSINPQNLDTIYQSWVDYAAQIDKTITEAISTAVGGYTTYKRGYTEWFLGSGTVEQLEFTANYLQKDFEALSTSLGASSVTVDNFLSMYDTAIKENFTQDTIEAWASLGDVLMKSTDAAKEYQDALDKLNGSTAYSLPVDMLLQNLSSPVNTVDIGELVGAQASGNKSLTKMVSYLYEIVKSQQELLKVTKYGSNQGMPA